MDQRSPFGRNFPRPPEPRTPLWFKVLFAIASLVSLAILVLMVWGVIELVTSLVGWLERH